MTINYRQLSILTFMSFIAVKLLALPSWLYIDSKNMSWLVVLVLMTIDLFFALIIIDLMKKARYKNFYEFLTNTLSVVLAKAVLILLIAKFIIVISILEKGLEFFILENLYEDFSWFVYGLPLIAISGFMVYKGIRNIARVAEFFWIIIIVGCLFIAVRAIGGVDMEEFLPVFSEGIKPVGKSMFYHLSWFGSSSFLFMLYGKVDFKSRSHVKPVLYMIGAVVLVMTLIVIFYGLFGGTSPLHQFCLSDISQYTKNNSSISELSWFIVCLWVVAQLIQLSIYGYCFVSGVMYLFNIHNKVVGVGSLVLLILAWRVFSYYIIDSEKIFLSSGASWTTISADYVLTILLVIANAIKTHKRGQDEEIKDAV